MKLDLKAEHTVYKDSEGKRLTGVTTYLGVLAKPQLLGWYASMEREGILSLAERLAADKGEDVVRTLALRACAPVVVGTGKPIWYAEAKRDRAADLGTVTHARCEAWLLKDELERDGIPADLYEKSQHGLDRFVAWWTEQSLTLLHSERVLVYDDGKMAYGGTADILARDKAGRTVLIDLKTSKASPWWPYDEVYGQVAAYAEACANDPNTALDVERIVVARIGKEPGDELQAVELKATQRAAGWRLFCAAYAAHEAKKELGRLTKR